MPALRRILCATDFSPASAPAWSFAQRLALATKANLLLLNVVPLIPVPIEGAFDPQTYQRLTDEGRAEALADLERMAHDDVDPSVRVTVRVEDGPPASRILAVAEHEGADIIVLGTHGRTGLNRLLVGSVAEQVLELAKCAVITVRPLPEAKTRPKRSFTRVLYPTDFSPASRRAWPWARAVAEASGAEVELVHVVLDIVPDRHIDPAILSRAAAVVREEAKRSAEEFVKSCGLPRDRVHIQVAHGVEADQIVHRAQAWGADLVVMGTHGRTGLVRLALGSVARRVLHSAPCPVLTVGPHTAEAPGAG